MSTIEAIAYTAVTAHNYIMNNNHNSIIRETTNVEELNAKISSSIDNSNNIGKSINTSDELFKTLLVLFQLQKHRVLQRVVSDTRGRAPKAIQVSGVGLGSWSYLTTSVADDQTELATLTCMNIKL